MEENLKELIREEEAKKIYQAISEEYNLQLMHEMIKNNFIEFILDDIQYKVHLLDSSEKEILDKYRRLKFGEMLQDKNILFKNQIIKLYREKGIDVDELETKIRRIEIAKKLIEKKTGELLTKDPLDKMLEQYKKEHYDLVYQQHIIQVQLDELLMYSFENQLENFVAEVIAFLSLEKKVEDRWIKCFSTLDEFQKDIDDNLKNQAAFRSLLLQVNFK